MSGASVISALRANIPSGASLLLCVSGGVDSTVLLHGVTLIASELGLKLHVAHVDHSLRVESEEDAEFVKREASALHLPLHHLKVHPPERGVNLEGWGREVRYDFFREIRKDHTLDWIVTAHTKNDVAETLLMQLVTNKDLSGISAIDPRRHLLRPLLGVSRSKIEEFASSRTIPFREDSTNADSSFLRNRVRQKLLPFLKEHFDGDPVAILSTRAEALREDIEAIRGIAGSLCEEISAESVGTKGWLRAVQDRLAPLLPSLRWRVAEELFLPIIGFRLGRSSSIGLVEFLQGHAEGIQLPSGITLRRKGGGIEILPTASEE